MAKEKERRKQSARFYKAPEENKRVFLKKNPDQ
jgi:hypothetical protein